MRGCLNKIRDWWKILWERLKWENGKNKMELWCGDYGQEWEENRKRVVWEDKFDNLIFYFLTYQNMLCMGNKLTQEDLEEIKS